MQPSPATSSPALASLVHNPYAPPTTDPAQAAHAPEKSNRHGLWHLAIGCALFVVTGLLMAALGWATPGTFGFAAVALIGLAGFARGIATLGRFALNPATASLGTTAASIFGVLTNGAMACIGAVAALIATVGVGRGRQLRRLGKVLLPDVTEGGRWAALPMQIAVDEQSRAGVAAQWRDNGRTEHASVAAFARLTLDLMALGAPPELIAGSNRDALDEIRHTELCFSIARALDGSTRSPAAFPEGAKARTLPANRKLALVALAVDSLVDGALHEGVSARMIAKLAKRCEEPGIRAVLKEIAADEGRHAAHGWDVVEWCLAEGGTAVADALWGATQALPRSMHGALPEAAEGGAWERYGIHGRQLEREEYARTRADLVQRVHRMIGERRAAA